jgi:alcohol dehydrogenase (cytochrome c)
MLQISRAFGVTIFVLGTSTLQFFVSRSDPDPRGSMGLGGTAGGAGFSYGANIDAIDYRTGKIVWRHATEGSPGLLTTAGKLLFSGDGNYLVALDPATGKTLWHTKIGAAGNAPETYMLDGHQYLLATGGDQLFAFVLNQALAPAAEKQLSAAGGH